MNKRIIYPTDEVGVAIIIPAPEWLAKEGNTLETLAAKDVPASKPWQIVDASDIPTDRTFREAWVMSDCCVEHDLDKCKTIGHDKRRAARSAEFAPHDSVIALQIPGANSIAAEAARVQIRAKYAAMQTEIDAATTPDEIKAALGM